MAIIRWIFFLPAAFLASVLAGALGSFITDLMGGALWYQHTMSGVFSGAAMILVGIRIAPQPSRGAKWALILLLLLLGTLATIGALLGTDRSKALTGLAMVFVGLGCIKLAPSELAEPTVGSRSDVEKQPLPELGAAPSIDPETRDSIPAAGATASSRPGLRSILKPKPWSVEYAATAAGWLLGEDALKIAQQLSGSLCQIRLDLESSNLPSEHQMLLAIELQAFLLEVTSRLLPLIMPSAPASEITRAMARFMAAAVVARVSVDESEIPRGIEFVEGRYSATASKLATYPLATGEAVLTGEFDAQLAEFVFARGLTVFLASSTDLSTDIMSAYYQRILFAVMETRGPLLQAMGDALIEAKDSFPA
jgi:hypothetical protein